MLDLGYRRLGVREDGVSLVLLSAIAQESGRPEDRKNLRVKCLLVSTQVGSPSGPPKIPPRCGSVGPLLRLGERTTTPDPSGDYDGTRGCRPQDVRVSSLRPHSKYSARHTRTTDDEPFNHEPTKAHNATTMRRADRA